ncbi:20776_t:CDS:1, partial [Racocetra persica]
KNIEKIYEELITLTTKALRLLEKQKIAENVPWARSIRKNFNPIKKIVNEVKEYRNRRILPLT